MKPLGDWLQQLGFSGGMLGIGLILAISCGSAGSASPVPVESASSQADSEVENSEAMLKPPAVVEPTISLPVVTADTKLRLIVVDRKDLEDKGDKGDKGEKVLSLNATSYEATCGTKSEPKVSLNDSLCASVVPPEDLPISHSAADLSAVTCPNSKPTLKGVEGEPPVACNIHPQAGSLGLHKQSLPTQADIKSAQADYPAGTPSANVRVAATSVVRYSDKIEMLPVEVGLTPSGNSISAGETPLSQTEQTPQPQATPKPASEQLDLSPEIIEGSPVLQRWLKKVPNVLEEIRHDPSFRTRLRLGYSQFPSTGQAAGFNVGVEDVFVGRTGLTVSGDYQRSFNGKREAYGADLRYYVLPLGSYVNVAPQVGYRNLTSGNFSTDGVNVGARLMLALSRTGAADISLTQSFVSPGSNEEVGITTLTFGYAVTRNLRLSTDIQKQNSKEDKDSRVGIVLEWMP